MKLKRTLSLVNRFQQRHHGPAVVFAVIKKYSDDQAGREAALLTYYGFLTLFPLLLLLTTLTNILIGHDAQLRTTIVKGLTSYFPLLGNQLSSHVHGLKQSGLPLLTGLAFTLYGTRGLASMARAGIQRVWLIPKNEWEGFPKTLPKDIVIILVGGLGFILASVSAGLASSAGRGWLFRLLSLLVNWFILYGLFSFLLKFSLPRRIDLKEIRLGGAMLATGLLILQAVGGYLLAHELKRLDALYSYFAVALGLLFWLYLQAQVFYYSLELAVVTAKKLWPRSLESDQPTEVDSKLVNLVS